MCRTRTATIVAKMKEAGAIILGKTAMPDFATSWFGYSSANGETRNPYDLDRDPGGSSAGTGAAIAANLATVGIGEDTGGSIRLPSSFNNLVGVRVTPGLISRKGLSPLVVFQDTAGPMGRNRQGHRDRARRRSSATTRRIRTRPLLSSPAIRAATRRISTPTA